MYSVLISQFCDSVRNSVITEILEPYIGWQVLWKVFLLNTSVDSVQLRNQKLSQRLLVFLSGEHRTSRTPFEVCTRNSKCMLWS